MESETSPILKGASAAAVLLLLVDEAEAASMLERLPPDDVHMLGSALYGVSDVDEGMVQSVLDNFVERARSRNSLSDNAHSHFSAAMHRALGAERADTMLGRVSPPEAKADIFEDFLWMEAAEIAGLIGDEHPQIIALVLAHLPADLAAQIITYLAELDQEDVLFRIATLGPVSASVLKELEPVLLKARRQKSPAAGPARGGTSNAASIMNALPKSAEARILKSVVKRDKQIAQAIEDEMFIFDDLAALDDRTLGTVLRGADAAMLVPALKGTDEKLRKRMLGAMSKRAAQTIADEIAERGPMPRSEVDQAQRAIIAVAKKMAAEGAIQLKGGGDDLV
jgi:flagellar motor switch protein FliG